MVRQVLLLRTHQSRVSRKISSCVMVQAMEEIGIARINNLRTWPRLGVISTWQLEAKHGDTSRGYQIVTVKRPAGVVSKPGNYFDFVTPALACSGTNSIC